MVFLKVKFAKFFAPKSLIFVKRDYFPLTFSLFVKNRDVKVALPLAETEVNAHRSDLLIQCLISTPSEHVKCFDALDGQKTEETETTQS